MVIKKSKWIIYIPIIIMVITATMNQPIIFLIAGASAAIIVAWGINIHMPKFIHIPTNVDLQKIKKIIGRTHHKSITKKYKTTDIEKKKKMAHGLLKVEKLTPDNIMTMASIFLKLNIARKIERWMMNMIKVAIFESGVIDDSRKIAHYSISLAFLAIPPTMVGGILLAIFVSPVFLAICAIPLGLLMSGIINLRIIKSQRKNAIGHELPIFIMCTSVMEQVGFSLYVFLERLSKTKTTLFPTIQKDAVLFTRNSTLLAMPHEKALKKIADMHPNQQFRDLVNDYTSARMTSGASTANTMLSATDTAFRNMGFKIKAYAGTAQGMAQMLLLMMATAPIMSIVSSILASGESATNMTVLMMLMLPMMSVMIILMIDGQQPRTHNPVNIARESIGIAIISIIIMAVIGRPIWEILGIGVAIFAGINASKNLGEFRMRAGLDKAMPKFLEEVSDGMMEGMSIYESIKRKVDHPNKSLRVILQTLSKKMYMGKGLVDAEEEIKSQSWLSHVVMFVLGHIHESGVASPQILRTFSNFTKDYQESRQELISSLRGVIGLGYVIPLIMGFMLIVSSQLISSIAGDFGDIERLPIALPSIQDTQTLTDSGFTLVVMCSALIGLVVSKIAYFTVKHTLHVCTMSIMAVIVCHAVPLVPPFF